MPKESKRSGGAYLLHLKLRGPARVRIGALGERLIPPGNYVYVGSARNGIERRVARHERLAQTKAGKTRWHIDRMLVHPQCELRRTQAIPGAEECAVSQKIARQAGVVVPVPGFGASDCRSGCPAHLYRVEWTGPTRLALTVT